jgi:hypothetical protein
VKSISFALFFLTATLIAQQPGSTNQPPQQAQVTGRVFCADTGQPARFAGVQLIADQPAKAPGFDPATLGKGPNFEKLFASALTSVMKGSNLSTVTGLDGSFSLDKVPPGIYYVVAQLPGYQSPLSQLSQLERIKADAATLKAVESTAEKIVIQANQGAHVDIRLERGASISGTVRYDDGSPAPGVAPILMVMEQNGKWKELGSLGTLPTTTNDRGHYRIFGVQAGKYALKAALPTMQASVGLGASVALHMNMGDALLVYSGGALREADVKPVEVGQGQDIDGIDIIFPLNNLHSVSGSVVAKSDNHAVDSGTIELEDSETKAKLRTTLIEHDGGFHLNYIPDGQYILRVTTAADTEKSATDDDSDFSRMLHSKALKSYGGAELPIILKSDSTGLVLQVPDTQAPPAKTSAAGSGPGMQ